MLELHVLKQKLGQEISISKETLPTFQAKGLLD